MPRKKRTVIEYNHGDSRYDKPFKFSKKHNAYLVTLQTKTSLHPELLDVVPDGGDRALPKGFVASWSKIPTYRIYIYKPGYAANVAQAETIGDADTLDAAIEAILEA